MNDRREELRSRGWSDDVDTRRARRPRQRIDPEDRPNHNGGLSLSPSWLYACTECGEERRIASEDLAGCTECDTCGEFRIFEPLGELVYPDEEEGG